MTNVSLFSQIIQHLDRPIFKKLVASHGSDKYCKGFNSWSHLISMLFCQLGDANSLRDIGNGMRSLSGNLNHLGQVKAPPKSTLANNNAHRNWELFKDYYYALYQKHSHLRESESWVNR
ncbi:MAG: DUF4372 domain-containing protein [Mangrovibacterium sp.]